MTNQFEKWTNRTLKELINDKNEPIEVEITNQQENRSVECFNDQLKRKTGQQDP